MSTCSGIYKWAGGGDPPQSRPQCSRAQHAELINRCGAALYKARENAYDWYCKQCKAWGREPEPEQTWFAHANAVTVRMRTEKKGKLCQLKKA